MLEGINFDEMPDEVRLYLTLPNKEPVAELFNVYGVEIEENYGGINTLTFKIPYRKKKDMKFVREQNIDIVNNDYLVKYEQGSIVEYYVITNRKNEYRDGKETMQVQCSSLSYQLSYKAVQLYKQVKPLYDFIGTNSILHDTLISLTNGEWTIGYVDVEVGIQYRSIDVSQTDLLTFLSQMANTFNLILKFDTVNNTVSFLKQENYGEDVGLVLDETTLRSLTEGEDSTGIYTIMFPKGKDGLGISSVNPTGQNYISDFSYYLYDYKEDALGVALTHSKYLSDALCHAILAYNTLVDSKYSTFLTLLSERAALVTSRVPYELLATTYQIDLNLIDANIDVNIKNSLSLTTLNEQRATKVSQINANQLIIDAINSSIAAKDAQKTALQTTLSISNNFTSELITEKSKFERVKTWTDTNYIDPNDLYKDGIERLAAISKPILTYEIDSIDLRRQLNSPRDWNRVKIGSVAMIRFEDFGINYDLGITNPLYNSYYKNIKAKIIRINHKLDDNSLTFTIANYKDIQSGFLKLGEILSKSISVGSMFDSSKGNWDLGKTANNLVTNYINGNLDAALQTINAGNNKNTQIDGRGITLTDNLDPTKILKLTNGVLAFSNTSGASYQTAVDANGINAAVVAGNLIVGNGLLVAMGNQSGTFSVNSSGVTISGASLTITGGLPSSQLDPSFKNGLVNLGTLYNGLVIDSTNGLTVTRSDTIIKTILNATDGFKFQKNTGTISAPIWSDRLYYSATTGNLTIDGEVNARELKVNGSSVLTADKSMINGGVIDKIKVEQLDATTAKIGTGQIENLVVGANVTMGANAVISWGQVINKDLNYSSITGSKPPTNADNTQSALVGNGFTTIGSNYIYTGTIEANKINAGTLTGFTIQTATSGSRLILSGSTFESLNGSTREGVLISSYGSSLGGSLSLWYGGTTRGVISANSSTFSIDAAYGTNMVLTSNNGFLQLNSSDIRLSGTVSASAISMTSGTIGGAVIATQNYVNSQTAKFG